MKVQTLEEPKLELAKLNQAIFDYEISHYDSKPYIICSKNTQKLLVKQMEPYCYITEIPEGKISRLAGYKVLTDETLPLGEFEIR